MPNPFIASLCWLTLPLIATKLPKSKCLGWRPYDASTKSFGNYQWIDYATVQRRRAALGRALVELHREAGVRDVHYGVGLWCQNRPEWQITGQSMTDAIPGCYKPRPAC